MGSYGATPDELNEYGAGLSIWESLRLLQKWSPLVSYARDFVGTADPYKKSLVVADAAEWLASQTHAHADDQLVRLLSDLLKTKEGEALVRWLLAQAEGVK